MCVRACVRTQVGGCEFVSEEREAITYREMVGEVWLRQVSQSERREAPGSGRGYRMLWVCDVLDGREGCQAIEWRSAYANHGGGGRLQEE